MTIEEIIEKAKQEGDGLKFKALEGQNVNPNVVFEVVDAHFKFLTYDTLKGRFFRVDDLKQIQADALYEVVEGD